MKYEIVKKENRYYIALFFNRDLERNAPVYLIEVYFPKITDFEIIERIKKE